jgi:alkyl sulfatase BDS1-like metallo-beta-lactamase superfamily hydrolase
LKIRELAERMWAGDADLVHEHHPVTYMDTEGEEVLDGLFIYKGIATANTLDTGDGLVMLDTGHQLDTDALHGAVRRWRPEPLLASAVYSHHHVDHVFGTAPFEQEAAERGAAPPKVYGHENIAAHFDRYLRTRGWNRAINMRQFAIHALQFQWPDRFRYPDVTYQTDLTFRQGDLTFELHHAKGETDDATWTWVPERRVLHAGDLFIWAVPNAGNPQKVQRYVSDWAAALRRMAACRPEVLLAGHGLPIFGEDRVQSALIDTADLLDSIEDQTLALMEQGRTLDFILHRVEVPERLRDLPYLKAVYDHPQFIVRNVWRRYGGWHDGEPDNLLPASRHRLAEVWVELAGGEESVLAKAADRVQEGELDVACHLVEFAVLADPGSAPAHRLRAEIYRARAALQTSSMARNILNHAALASEQGRRDLAES